jgi:hypothetical protein
VEAEVEGRAEARRAGEEVSELDDEGGGAVVLGFWKSFRISTLLSFGVGVGVGEGAGAEEIVEGGVEEGEAEADLARRGMGAFGTTEDVDGLDCFKDDEPARVDAKEGEALPFTGEFVAAGTDPNDFTPSDLIGGTEAGEEDIGAAASSMEPKVTAEPCFAAPTLPRGMLTPSFMDTP